MIVCAGCSRHHRPDESACPFCGKAPSNAVTKALNLAGGAVTTIVLAACYGGVDTDTDYKGTDTGNDNGLVENPEHRAWFDADGKPIRKGFWYAPIR